MIHSAVPDAAESMTLPLSACTDASLVGGKAINLARLINAGFNVPGGFVVTTAGYLACRDAGGAIRQDLAQQIADRYRAMGSPPVAVRSSATAEDMAEASMAGQYETFLNITGKQGVLEAVQRCWASLNTERTRAYLAEHGIPIEQVAMAVVVQRLIPADTAGVLFTVNPRSGEERQMLIEANWGLGDTVVSGEAQPDTLTVGRDDGRVLEAHIADKQVMLPPGGTVNEPVPEGDRHRPCLTSHDVHALWQLGLRVHEHFGRPQDIEWAIADGEVFLLQSRAITTLDEMAALRRLRESTRRAVREALEAGRGPWVPHNLAETLPAPTPLTWSVMRRFLRGTGGLGNMYRAVGFEPGPSVQDEPFVDLIGGRISMDLARAGEMFFADFPFAYDPEALREDPDAGQSPPTLPRGGIRQRMRVGRRLGAVQAEVARLVEDFDHRLEGELIPEFMRWVDERKAVDLRGLSDEELFAAFRGREQRVMDEFAPMSLLPTLLLAQLMSELKTLLREHVFDRDADDLAQRLAAGGPADLTVKANHELYRVARGELPLGKWLERHGHRAPEEFDLATPRWHERPGDAESLAHALREGADPLARHQELAERTAALAGEVRAELPAGARTEFDRLLDRLHRYMRFREDAKFYLMHGYELLRTAALEAGRRLGVGDDVFYLTDEELEQSLRSGYVSIAMLGRRKAEHAAARKLALPHLIDADSVEQIGRPAERLAGDRMDAFALSAGVGRGPARIVDRPEQGTDLGAGYILVCHSTDPSWTPLFVNAAGLVLESGGSLSHGAVVAREMGIPAVVLPDAKRRLTGGQTVTVDADHGAVFIGDARAREPAADAQPSADDTRIPADRVPPPPGPIERRGAKVRNAALSIWAAYFLLVFLPWVSPTWVYRPTMKLLDVLFWPVVAALGPVWAVAAIAAGLAAVIMLLQRLMTDHGRLVLARDRAKALERQAMHYPPGSRRRAALLAGTGGVQGRLIAASFLPLAVVLGPLVMLFLWLPLRVAPAVTNPAPGATVTVKANLNSDYLQPVTLHLPDGLTLVGSEASQQLHPVRKTLEAYAAMLKEQRAKLAAPTIAQQLAFDTALAREIQSLDGFLAGIPDQTLSWTVGTPADAPGAYPVRLEAEGQKPLEMAIVVGQRLPPDPDAAAALGSPTGVVDASVVYPGRKPHELIFWQPLAWLGLPWDIGWLGVYIIAYVPAMFLAKWTLRIP